MSGSDGVSGGGISGGHGMSGGGVSGGDVTRGGGEHGGSVCVLCAHATVCVCACEQVGKQRRAHPLCLPVCVCV